MAPTYVPPEIASIEGVIDTYRRWKYANDKYERKYYSYHPSEWGKCLRAQQFKRYAQMGLVAADQKPRTSQSLMVLDNGHAMHARWAGYFEDMGILRGNWKCRNTFCLLFNEKGELTKDLTKELAAEFFLKPKFESRIFGENSKQGIFKPKQCVCGCRNFKYLEAAVRDEEMNFVGHCDAILDFSGITPDVFGEVRKTFNIELLPEKPIVIDMKSAKDQQFNFQCKKIGPHPEYVIQLTIYVHLLDCEYGIIIYENKNNCDRMLFKVDRNEELFQKIREQAKLMNGMIDPPRLPPPKPDDQEAYECRGCDFEKHCHTNPIWKDPALAEKREKFYGGV